MILSRVADAAGRARRLLADRRARQRFAGEPLQLNAVQQRVLADLETTGLAAVPYAALTGDDELWLQMSGAVDRWLASDTVMARERAYAATGYTRTAEKDYILRYYGLAGSGSVKSVPWSDPWVPLTLSQTILNVANSYLGVYSTLYDVDIWDTMPRAHADRDVGSQRWHRDSDDRPRMLTAFLYFTDVDETNGALEFVPGTRPEDVHGDFVPENRRTDALEQFIPRERWITCAHPAKTILFADTAALHRGGRAALRRRVMATWRYLTPKSQQPRRFRLEGNAPTGLTAAARAAIIGAS